MSDFINCRAGDRITSLKIDGHGYDNAINCSSVDDVLIEECHILGGLESAIDIDGGSSLYVHNCIIKPSGNFSVKVDGEVESLKLIACSFDGHGKKADIDLSFWDKEKKKSIHIQGCHSLDGKPLKVKCLYPEALVVTNSDVEIISPNAASVFFFKLAKMLRLA